MIVWASLPGPPKMTLLDRLLIGRRPRAASVEKTGEISVTVRWVILTHRHWKPASSSMTTSSGTAEVAEQLADQSETVMRRLRGSGLDAGQAERLDPQVGDRLPPSQSSSGGSGPR